MNLHISGLLTIAAFAAAGVLGSTETLARNAYIANSGANTVSVINTATNKVTCCHERLFHQVAGDARDADGRCNDRT